MAERRISLCSCKLGTFWGGCRYSALYRDKQGTGAVTTCHSSRNTSHGAAESGRDEEGAVASGRAMGRTGGGRANTSPDARGHIGRVCVTGSSPPHPVCRDSPAPTVATGSAPRVAGSVLVTAGVRLHQGPPLLTVPEARGPRRRCDRLVSPRPCPRD